MKQIFFTMHTCESAKLQHSTPLKNDKKIYKKGTIVQYSYSQMFKMAAYPPWYAFDICLTMM